MHWRPWGPEALAEAKALNRPILLSVGYAACHWCHVMAHESFEDPPTAEVMNRLFVNIKVDREERPDVDQIYMSALQAMGEQGGWPLTMFLTPAAEPIWGGTYFPKEPRYGRPPFIEVLHSVAGTFAEHPDRVEGNRVALLDHLNALPRTSSSPPGPAQLDEAAALASALIDNRHGGLGGAPKFPQPALMEFLWRSAERSGTVRYREQVLLTLRHICQGGIYDHIGGGIARYSIDDHWLVPHFEKMLYDNALLLRRLTAAWRATGEDLFRIRIEETIAWLLREMRVGDAFGASLDADSEGGEGSFYVWRPAEITEALGRPAAAEFGAAYDITPDGNFEGGASIPNRLSSLEPLSPEAEARLAAARLKLLAARATRPRPARDDKILADWNGLAITALAEAGFAFGRDDWLKAAETGFRFVTELMTDDGRLRHAFKDGRLLPVGFAADHAALMTAALALHQATLDPRYLRQASALAEALDTHFWDVDASAYRMTADDADALIARPLPIFDDSVPSANALAAVALARLASLTGDMRHADRAQAIVTAHCGEARSVLGKAGLFSAADQLLGSTDVVLIVPDAATPGALLSVIRKGAPDVLTLLVVSAGSALPSGHPATGKTALAGEATAYVCRGQSCSAPVTTPEALARLLIRQ